VYASISKNLAARDPKTEALVAEIVDTEWIETDSEIDALFLEAEMVKRYMPRFNIHASGRQISRVCAHGH
jgi:excinuclease ABC subunit C